MTLWLTAIWNYSPRASAALFWPLWKPGAQVVHIHTHRQNTHAHKLKLNLKKQRNPTTNVGKDVGKEEASWEGELEQPLWGSDLSPQKCKNRIATEPTWAFAQRTPCSTSEMSARLFVYWCCVSSSKEMQPTWEHQQKNGQWNVVHVQNRVLLRCKEHKTCRKWMDLKSVTLREYNLKLQKIKKKFFLIYEL